MAIEFTPHLVTLTYEAALKSFWRKPALTKFLRECHISHNFLSSWSVDETKRQLLDRLFDLLQKNDTGKKVIGFVAQIKFELGFSLTPYLSKNTLCRWRTQMRETV
jgi:hypothetical protein